MIARAWARQVAFWSEREDGRALALVRICMGLTFTWTCFSGWWWDAVPVFVDEAYGGLASSGQGRWPVPWFGGNTPGVVTGFLAAGGLAGLLTAAGFGGRLTLLLTGQIALCIFSFHGGTGGGHDRVYTNAFWLLAVGDATATWSLDARRRTGAWHDPAPILSLGRRLLLWQLVYMYTLTGLQKQGSAWFAGGDYRALYDTLLLPSWAKYDLSTVLPYVFPLTQVSTIIAWWWEALWPIVLLQAWARRPSWAGSRWGARINRFDARPAFVFFGLVTHLVLWVLCDLGPFSPVTLALYPTLWTGADTAAWRTWRDRKVQPAAVLG